MEMKIPLGYKELGRKIKREAWREVSRGSAWVAVRGKGLLGIESLIGS